MTGHASNPSTAAPCAHGGTQAEPREADAVVSVEHAANLLEEAATVLRAVAEIQLATPQNDALMERMPTPRYLTARDIADMLRVDAKTVRRWRTNGLLPDPIVIGGVIRWRADEIDSWLGAR